MWYTPGSSNMSLAGKWGPRIESMYFLLKMGIFHCYVCLPEGSHIFFFEWSWGDLGLGFWDLHFVQLYLCMPYVFRVVFRIPLHIGHIISRWLFSNFNSLNMMMFLVLLNWYTIPQCCGIPLDGVVKPTGTCIYQVHHLTDAVVEHLKRPVYQGTRKGVAPTVYYHGYLLCSTLGFLGLGDYKPQIPTHHMELISGFPMTGYVGIGVHPTIPWV